MIHLVGIIGFPYTQVRVGAKNSVSQQNRTLWVLLWAHTPETFDHGRVCKCCSMMMIVKLR